MKSAMRYYLNNFTDGAKQDAIDFATGNYTVQKGTPFGSYNRMPMRASESWSYPGSSLLRLCPGG